MARKWCDMLPNSEIHTHPLEQQHMVDNIRNKNGQTRTDVDIANAKARQAQRTTNAGYPLDAETKSQYSNDRKVPKRIANEERR